MSVLVVEKLIGASGKEREPVKWVRINPEHTGWISLAASKNGTDEVKVAHMPETSRRGEVGIWTSGEWKVYFGSKKIGMISVDEVLEKPELAQYIGAHMLHDEVHGSDESQSRWTVLLLNGSENVYIGVSRSAGEPVDEYRLSLPEPPSSGFEWE